MPTERRALDPALNDLTGRSEEEAVAFWRGRLEQIAAIPVVTARAGALIPEWRELAGMPRERRVALTRARMLAALQLSEDVRAKVFEARDEAKRQAPAIEAEDDAFLKEHVVPTLPQDAQERVRRVDAGMSR